MSEDIPIGVLRLASGWEVRPIPGHPGYYATRDGRIICETWGRWLPHPQVVAQSVSSNNYFTVSLRSRTHTVHSLVALAFHGPPQAGQSHVRHLDGDRQNNRADNLRWGSQSENEQDKLRHGSQNKQILTVELAADIKRRLAAGENPEALAEEFQVKIHIVDDIKCGKSWSFAAPEITVEMMQAHDHRYGPFSLRRRRRSPRRRRKDDN